MFNPVQLLSFFWFLATFRAILFWIYLWQLKEYHIGRLIDHFRTDKGKKIFVNVFFLVKLVLLVVFFIDYMAAMRLLLLVYAAESLLLVMGRYKRPVWTVKTGFLTVISVVTMGLFLLHATSLSVASLVLDLLIFSILVPDIVSGIVLIVQPVFVFARNQMLQEATNKIAQYKNLTVIGITGSYGKTSTKEFLATILFSKFNVLSTKEHNNSEVGIAKTVLGELNESHEIFVVEMGSYAKGGIKLLSDIVKPSIGMVTGVNEQHLATFGSMENLLSAEGGQELLRNLPPDGLIVVNGDNKYCLDLYKGAKINKMVYSLHNDKVESDIWAEEITIHEHYLDFLAVTKNRETMHIDVNVLGKQNVQNLLGAILVAKELGMNLEEIAAAAKQIRQGQAGITFHRGIHGINIIDSSYSSNPDGVMADLDYLRVFSGKKVVVMPCLIELGQKSADIHVQIGKKIAEVCDMAIIVTKDRFEEIKKGAIENGMNVDRIFFSEKPKDILNTITTFCKKGDAVLLEGRVPGELIKLLQ